MKKYLYLFSLVFVFIIPTIAMGANLRGIIHLNELIPFIISITIIGSIWDLWATKHRSKDSIWLWKFNKKDTLGIKILGVPIEEYIFYIVSSVYVIFMWEGIKQIANGKNDLLFSVLIISVWTLLWIFIPQLFSGKHDKLIG